MEGITATAYDADGDMVGSALSGADGTYELPVAGAFSADLRIEFSGWPDEYEPAFAAQGAEPPSVLGANDTSVQFVTLDGAGDATGVDFGLVIPDQVVQTNAPIATAIQYAGLRTSTAGRDGIGGRSAVVADRILRRGELATRGPADPRHLRPGGLHLGLTYNRITNAMIIGSVFKRMSDLGSLGLGGIYRVDDVLAPDGSITAGATAQPWFSVQGLPVATGGTIDLGQSLVPADRGLGAPADPARDISAFQYAARVGMGGIATSLDGETLFVTNLNDRQIYAIDVSDPTQAPSQAFRVATPVGTAQQLWALTEYSDRLYMGFVDTGVAPGVAAADANMQAYVVSVPTAVARSGLNSGRHRGRRQRTGGWSCRRASATPRDPTCRNGRVGTARSAGPSTAARGRNRPPARRSSTRSSSGGTAGPTNGDGPVDRWASPPAGARLWSPSTRGRQSPDTPTRTRSRS